MTFDQPYLCPFDNWAEVLDYCRTYGRVFYKAPMSPFAIKVPVRVKPRGRTVRVMVTIREHDCEPFTADSKHLERFLRHAPCDR